MRNGAHKRRGVRGVGFRGCGIASIVLLMGLPAPDAAYADCMSDLTSSEGATNCPANPSTNPCTITAVHTINSDCDLSFAGRDVTIDSHGALNIGAHQLQITAKNLTINPAATTTGGRIAGENGKVRLDVEEHVWIQATSTHQGRISITNVTNVATASIVIGAGWVTVDGSLEATGKSYTDPGGTVTICTKSIPDGTIPQCKDRTAGTGEVTVGSTGVLSASGGGNGAWGGGIVTIRARGSVAVDPVIDVSGGSRPYLVTTNPLTYATGGQLDIDALGDILLKGNGTRGSVSAQATLGDGIDGGTVTLHAGGKVEAQNKINVNGNGNSTDGLSGSGGIIEVTAGTDATLAAMTLNGDAGGDGGSVDITAQLGNANLQGSITADGADGGSADSISVTAGGIIAAQAAISASGPGGGDGGEISLDAGGGHHAVTPHNRKRRGWGWRWHDQRDHRRDAASTERDHGKWVAGRRQPGL